VRTQKKNIFPTFTKNLKTVQKYMEKTSSELVIGIDIGGTNFKFALTNKDGVSLKKDIFKYL
jgi:activator of 2-hydroxyglutaryl-CoA dehydratase